MDKFSHLYEEWFLEQWNHTTNNRKEEAEKMALVWKLNDKRNKEKGQ